MVIRSFESQRIWICSFCFVMAAVCPMTRVASANVDEVTHEIHFIIISHIFWKVARRFAEGYYLYNQIHRFVIPWYFLSLKFPAPLWQLAATLKVPRPKTVGTKTAVVNQSNSFGLLFFVVNSEFLGFSLNPETVREAVQDSKCFSSFTFNLYRFRLSARRCKWQIRQIVGTSNMTHDLFHLGFFSSMHPIAYVTIAASSRDPSEYRWQGTQVRHGQYHLTQTFYGSFFRFGYGFWLCCSSIVRSARPGRILQSHQITCGKWKHLLSRCGLRRLVRWFVQISFYIKRRSVLLTWTLQPLELEHFCR